MSNFGYDDDPLSAFSQYMQEMRRIPRLTAEEEAQLIVCVERGKVEQRQVVPDPTILEQALQARNCLVEGYQPLVIYFAKKYIFRIHRLDMLDLIQEGNLGVMRALDYYDMQRGFLLTTLVVRCIGQAMYEAVTQQAQVVKLSDSVLALLRQKRCAVDDFEREWGRAPSLSELAAVLHLSEDRLETLLVHEASLDVRSLQALFETDADRGDFTVLFAAEVEADNVRQAVLEESIQQAIARELTPRQQEVVRLRYGFDGPMYTDKEVHEMLGIRKNGVRVHEQRAYRRLHGALAPLCGLGYEGVSA